MCVSLEGKEQALAKGAVPVLVKLLKDASADVRAVAAGCVMKCVSAFYFIIIIHPCSHSFSLFFFFFFFFFFFSFACDSVAITTAGKLALLKAEAAAALTALLQTSDKEEHVLLNTIKAITVLAEAPEGRKAFAPCVDKLKALLTMTGTRADPAAVSRAAQKCIDTITWRP